MPDSVYELDRCDPLNERQFRLAVKRLADTLAYGSDRSPFLGSGMEYVQSRLYVPGDPIKSIDWRVTARTAKVHVKEYEAPKRMPVYLLVDTSASMTVSSARTSKYGWAIQIAGGLALACLARASPVGVMGVGERDLRRLPSLSREQVYEWLFQLRRYRLDERTALAARVTELGATLKNRATIIILSDLHDADALPSLRLLGQRHDVIALQLEDPAERDLRGAGIFLAQEAETGEVFATHGRKRWLDPELVADDLKRGRIDHLRIPIDRPFLHKLSHFFRTRDRVGRGSR
ncbi:MAG TPA: DUF58 domain-containing protein [Planctomycetota bacterium]|nr:DUF58 domain-containing protein [Planctomycetota bacterium]